MISKVFCTTLALLVMHTITGQVIHGKVVDKDLKPITGSTVSLHSKDSALLKSLVTGTEGDFSFDNISRGDYFIRVSSMEAGDTSLNIFHFQGTGDLAIQVVLSRNKTKELTNITVTGKRRVVEVQGDKITFNVENSINATGLDALELLKRSPGVLVDQNESITIAGRAGVQIYIDGKISPLQEKDLANFLKSIQSSMVEAIEVILNPSSKYDAAGTGGIINIKLKKNRQYGTNGNVIGNYNLGVYSRYLGGISLNHRNAKVNVFSNFNYSNGISYNELDVYRHLADSTFDLYSKKQDPQRKQ